MGLAFGLEACSTIDHVGERSVRYNVAAVDSRSRTILTNVVRAAYGKPLQFSDLTTASGQATLGGELGLSLPFDANPDTTARTFSAAPKITASGTSNFTVASLNSKEFYQGLQTPISVQQIANFIAAGYDPQLLLFLTISDIEVRKPEGRIAFQGNADSAINYRLFYQAVAFLREAGLSTRPGDALPYGPVVTSEKLTDAKVVAALLSAAPGELTLKEDPKSKGSFRFYRKGSYEFCFDPMKSERTTFQTQHAKDINGNRFLRLLKTSDLPIEIKGALVVDGGVPLADASFPIEAAYFCDPPEGAEKTLKTKILIRTRSVEGIFQLLGQVARSQLKLEDGANDQLSIMTSDGKGYLTPFRIVEGTPANAALTIQDEGKTYSILMDPSGKTDQTTRVFQLLTDLLALQSSAKDLPSPNLISILGR